MSSEPARLVMFSNVLCWETSGPSRDESLAPLGCTPLLPAACILCWRLLSELVSGACTMGAGFSKICD